MNYDDQLDYEYIIHCLKIENNRLLRSVRRLKAEQSIDEGCVGCAGPCKAVDVSANLQKELDECSHTNSFLHEELGAIMGQLADSRNRCGYLSTELGLREAELFDLKNAIPDNLWAVVTERDSVIRQQGKTINELKNQNIKDLKELYDLDKEDIEDLRSQLTDCKKIDCHNAEGFKNIIDGLEAELSARKEDSAVLMKVVDVIHNDSAYMTAVHQIADIVKDYLNTPEGPPETPIDEDQDIEIVFTYGEIL